VDEGDLETEEPPLIDETPSVDDVALVDDTGLLVDAPWSDEEALAVELPLVTDDVSLIEVLLLVMEEDTFSVVESLLTLLEILPEEEAFVIEALLEVTVFKVDDAPLIGDVTSLEDVPCNEDAVLSVKVDLEEDPPLVDDVDWVGVKALELEDMLFPVEVDPLDEGNFVEEPDLSVDAGLAEDSSFVEDVPWALDVSLTEVMLFDIVEPLLEVISLLVDDPPTETEATRVLGVELNSVDSVDEALLIVPVIPDPDSTLVELSCEELAAEPLIEDCLIDEVE
jgi:hypothetical protein